MKSDDLSEYFNTWRSRRNFNIFIASLVCVVLSSIAIAIIHAFGLERYIPYALPGLGVLLVTLGGRAVRQARARRRQRLQLSPMSRDELRVARSKLMEYRKAKNL